MSPFAQIGIAVLAFITLVAGLFTITAALIRVSPADPGDIAVTDLDAAAGSNPAHTPR